MNLRFISDYDVWYSKELQLKQLFAKVCLGKTTNLHSMRFQGYAKSSQAGSRPNQQSSITEESLRWTGSAPGGKHKDKWSWYGWRCKNNGKTPKSAILIGFSIINHPFWSTPIFGNIHIVSLHDELHDFLQDFWPFREWVIYRSWGNQLFFFQGFKVENLPNLRQSRIFLVEVSVFKNGALFSKLLAPLGSNPFHMGIPGIQTTGTPNQQLTISWLSSENEKNKTWVNHLFTYKTG